MDTGLTVSPASSQEYGTDYWWAVAIKNTSATDLLVTVDFDSGGTAADGRDHGERVKLHTILPGQTMYTGRFTGGKNPPVKLNPFVVETEWYPMSELALRGFDAGLELTEGGFDSATSTYVHATYTSRSVGVQDQPVDILVALRDSRGKLLGAIRVSAGGNAVPAGPRTIAGDFDEDRWPPEADRAKSQILISSTCCAIIPD
ncbi:hypothetical protein [Actinorhabdospora filicis]|uniref:hypothetical protein n=1 Tax=Actinorhabdospora filicis TaxID=1785913 RepID=UPI002555F786|nr:hypothetical protein [Actinorhabdospora filicis]